MDKANTIDIHEPETPFANAITRDIASDELARDQLHHYFGLDSRKQIPIVRPDYLRACSYTSTMFEADPWATDRLSNAVVASVFLKFLYENPVKLMTASAFTCLSTADFRGRMYIWAQKVIPAPSLGEHATSQLPSEQFEDVFMRFPQIERVGLAVYTEEGLREFLTTPMERFGGRSGVEVIRDGESDLVLSALASDYEGLG